MSPDKPNGDGGHGRQGIWMMVACCVPMVVIVVLIALKVL